jgi:hypothetical protein
MSRTGSPVPCADCDRPKGRTKSPRCARCRARRGRLVAAAGKREWRDRAQSVPIPATGPEEYGFTDEELQFEPPEGDPEPAPPPPAPISHVPPPPMVETRPPAPATPVRPAARSRGAELADENLIDLSYAVTNRSRALEERLRVRDELKRRLPTASPTDRETILLRLRMVESELG